MSMYLKLTNGVPDKYTLFQLYSDNPNTSFPADPSDALLATYDVYPYTIADVTYDPITQRKVEGQFVQVDTQWTLFMVAENLPLDQAEANVRRQRDGTLFDCDWTQLPDSPLSADSKTAWSTYRQQLRDITGQAGFPYSVVWPTPPE